MAHDEDDGMPFDVSSADSDQLYELFEAIGILSNGGEEHFHANFPTDGDETATYKNGVFRIRRYWWGDREDDFDPELDVNFEHFPSGLKIGFYKHVGRSTKANRALRDGEMAEIAQQCRASLGPHHKKGLPRPAAVGTVTAVSERQTAKDALQRTIAIDGVDHLCFDATVRTPKVGEEIAVRVMKRWKGNDVIAHIEEPADLAEAKALFEGPLRSFTRFPDKDHKAPDGSLKAKAWRDDGNGRVIVCWPNLDPNLIP